MENLGHILMVHSSSSLRHIFNSNFLFTRFAGFFFLILLLVKDDRSKTNSRINDIYRLNYKIQEEKIEYQLSIRYMI